MEVDRRQGDRRNVSFTNDEEKHKILKELPKENIVFDALEALPPVRRIVSIPDKLDQDDGAAALGAASLALINLPEDWRDIKQSAKQIQAWSKDKDYKGSYNVENYKDYQHPFSFFKGTLLHNIANPNQSKNPELASKLLKTDRTLFDTKIGDKIVQMLHVDVEEVIETPIKTIMHTDSSPSYINAYKFKGNGRFAILGELTARAMTRTTLLGVGAMSLLELPKILKARKHGKNIEEKAESTGKQLIKSTMNVALTTAGIGYGGALGFKKFGATGSLIGMGFGAVLGSYISKKAQNSIG